MKSVDLENLDKWFQKQLNKKFSKEHKFMKKRIFERAQLEIQATKNALKSWISKEKYDTSSNEGKPIPEKTKQIIERFVEKVMDSLNSIEIPGFSVDICYSSCFKFCEQVRDLYQQYNISGKKSIPRFRSMYNLEIKELDLHLRKIGEASSKTAEFLRKRYPGGKEADVLLKKIPNIQHNIEQLGTARNTYEEMMKNVENMEKQLDELKKEYEKLLETPELSELQKVTNQITREKRNLRSFIKYNKAFKKLRKGMEDGILKFPNLDANELRKYIKSPIDELLNEGLNTPRLREILIKVRLILEDQENPLKIKKDQRERIIDNINEIINHKGLEPKLQLIINLIEKKDKISKILEKKGIKQKREELADKIQSLTLDLEHFTNDLKHKKRDYDSLLQKVIKYRSFLETRVKEELDKEIKINIIIPE